ncbi:hypothetical protein NpPPO83_00010049, partial [Neofusicoccum parvum]
MSSTHHLSSQPPPHYALNRPITLLQAGLPSLPASTSTPKARGPTSHSLVLLLSSSSPLVRAATSPAATQPPSANASSGPNGTLQRAPAAAGLASTSPS